MLQSLRERTSGVVAWFIVGLLTIPFAFFGIDQFATGTADPKVATVGDEDITLNEFRNAYAQRYQRLVQMLGEDFDASTLDQTAFRSAVLEGMISESANQQYAAKQGWRVSDEALVGFLREVPAFQQDGSFSPEAYRTMLSRQGLSPARYERDLREGLRVEQLRQAVVDSAFLTSVERRHIRAIAEQRRSFDVVRIPATRFLREIEPTEEQLQAAYEANKSQYQLPERVRLSYVVLDRNDIAASQSAPDASVLREIYEAEKARLSQPEQREVRHILAEGADGRERIEAAAERIRGGESFEDVAADVSDDSGSAEEGGRLGRIERGDMVPGFEEAAFGLAQDTLSEPVETEFGWHLIRVDAIEEATTQAFDAPEVQERLLSLYAQREADVVFRDSLETLERLAFEQPTSLEPAATEIDARVQETQWLTREDQEGLFANPRVVEAAFSEVVMAGENSTPIEVSPSRVIVLRQRGYEEARIRDFREVRDQVAADYRAREARQRAESLADEISARIAGGETLTEVAETLDLSVRSVDAVQRNTSDTDRRIVRTVFSMPRPDRVDGRVSLQRVPLGDEGVALVQLRSVMTDETAPSVADATTAPDSDPRIIERLRGRTAGLEFDAYSQHIAQSVSVNRRDTSLQVDR